MEALTHEFVLDFERRMPGTRVWDIFQREDHVAGKHNAGTGDGGDSHRDVKDSGLARAEAVVNERRTEACW